jgi:hypothetical protein
MEQISAKRQLALETAGLAWTTDKTSKITLDSDLAKAFADIIEKITSEPYLGNATTNELINEIRTRIEMDGMLEYRTVDSEHKRNNATVIK